MQKPLRWFYELTPRERQSYPLDRMIVGFDRAEGTYITAAEVYVVRERRPTVNLSKRENMQSR